MFLTLKDEQNETGNSGINIPDGAEYVQEIPISEISDFPDHPFKVRQDEAMLNMTESIRENGVRQPAIVRPMPDGGYQMLSGHRRKAACMAIGKLTIPAVVREMSDDEAIICMVEANHQRENILPSERAFSYIATSSSNICCNASLSEGNPMQSYSFPLSLMNVSQ